MTESEKEQVMKMTKTIRERMTQIRDFTREKGFPDGKKYLEQKLLWAHAELSEAVKAHRKIHFRMDNRSVVDEELIDVIFYILDFWEIIATATKAQLPKIAWTDMTLQQAKSAAKFIGFNLLAIQEKLGDITNHYKKGIDYISMSKIVWRCLTFICSSIEGNPDNVFDMKLSKNMNREFQFGQKRELTK